MKGKVKKDMKKILLKFADSLLTPCAYIGLPIYKVTEKNKRDKKRVAGTIISTFLLIIFCLSFVLLLASCWINLNIGNINLSAVIYTLQHMQGGVNFSDFIEILPTVILPVVIFVYIFVRYQILCLKYENISFSSLSGDKKIDLKFKKNEWIVFAVLIFILSSIFLYFSGYILGADKYIKRIFYRTEIFEDNYISPTEEVVVFPDKKRNLIYISLESMENTYMDKANGGDFDDNYIPHLTQLADENISFSNTSSHGGASLFPSGTDYTMASYVCETAGLPLLNSQLSEKYPDRMIPGALTLEDVLTREGYNQMLIQGSDGKFADLDKYYVRDSAHENVELVDYYQMIEDGEVPKDHYENWGIEDNKLYEIAKNRITEISKKSEPFAVTLFTMDTHYPDGYVCELCENKFDSQYANVINCADDQIYDFVNWLNEQDFYENTTIIITGDHPSMKNDFFKKDGYTRTTYNCIINSPIKAENTKNRTFTTVDIFPTTLAAIGAEIKGDRLGIGTDLFSDTPTLPEEMGAQAFSDELDKYSKFYNEGLCKYSKW